MTYYTPNLSQSEPTFFKTLILQPIADGVGVGDDHGDEVRL